MTCRMNSAGDFCGSVDFISAQSNWNLSITTGSSCTAECNESLIDAGCCFSNLDFLQDLFTLCDLNFPSPCPETLTIPTITSDPSCQTDEDIFMLDTELTCSVASPILDSLNSNNCPSSFTRNFELQCSMRDGELCIKSAFDNSTVNELASAIANCPSVSSCSTNCEASLRNLSNNLGCCLNLFNSSYTMGTEFFNPESSTIVLDNDLWQECGITPPGSCFSAPSSTAPSSTAPSSAAVGNRAFTFFPVIIFFHLYHIYVGLR